MALQIVVRTEGDETWAKLAEDAPPDWIFERPEGGLLLRRGKMSTTGVHLVDSEKGKLVLELPLFMGPTDYVALSAFLLKVCDRVGADHVEVSGERIEVRELEQVIDDQLAPQLTNYAMSKLPDLMDDPKAVIVIEGRERPFLLGKHTLERLAANAEPEDLYEAIVELVSHVQEVVSNEKTFVAPAAGVESDGERYVLAAWDPGVLTITMPCDILDITGKGTTYRVRSEHIAEVVGQHGVLVDEYSWLLMPATGELLDALLARAAERHDPL